MKIYIELSLRPAKNDDKLDTGPSAKFLGVKWLRGWGGAGAKGALGQV